MSDTELRKIVLAEYYQRRKEDFIQIAPARIDSPDIEQAEIYRISQQLHERGLIKFVALPGNDIITHGKGKITAAGVDFVESNYLDPKHPQTTISINTSGGPYVDGNVHTGGDFIGRDQSQGLPG